MWDMKQVLIFGMVWGCVAAAAMAADPVAEQPAAQAPAAAQAGQAVLTFDTNEQLQAFEALWRQRQFSLVRMTVLQSYWKEEQAMVTKIDGQLTSEYKLDMTKQYSFDPQRRALLEWAAPPPAASTPSPEPAQPSS